jgi:hypothetical protein
MKKDITTLHIDFMVFTVLKIVTLKVIQLNPS